MNHTICTTINIALKRVPQLPNEVDEIEKTDGPDHEADSGDGMDQGSIVQEAVTPNVMIVERMGLDSAGQ